MTQDSTTYERSNRFNRDLFVNGHEFPSQSLDHARSLGDLVYESYKDVHRGISLFLGLMAVTTSYLRVEEIGDIQNAFDQ
jgi:hypothetical protein